MDVFVVVLVVIDDFWSTAGGLPWCTVALSVEHSSQKYPSFQLLCSD